MNYGYGPTAHDEELAKQLTEMLKTIGLDENGLTAYVETDCLYPGVRIRRMTHYSEEIRRTIIRKADVVYDKLYGF